MKQWWKRIVALLAVACIILGNSHTVMAEGTRIPTEIVEKYFGEANYPYYDVGGSVGNGMFEIKSSSNSLKAGDTVEVEFIYNTDAMGYNLSIVIIEFYYDKDLLEYSGSVMNKAYGDSSFHLVSDKHDETCVRLFIETSLSNPFNQNGCIATAQFTVKQDTSDVTVYGGRLDASSSGAVSTYHYLDDLTEDGGEKMMSVTVKDSSISDPAPETGTFALSNGTVKGNGEIMIPIDIKTNDGFATLGLTINYDKDIFAYKDLKVDSKLKDKFELENINPTDGQIKASYLAKQNITDVGSLLNLTLETKENASVGATSDVKISVTQVANYEEESLKGTGAVYTVTLVDSLEQMLGDVNNDGKIDREDALCILQYYNDVKQLTDDEKTAADVDKNGAVDLVDALRIMKYYNGEISEF